MPEMDGVALRPRADGARGRSPIVIISIASESGEQVLAALDAGAVDFVQKPTALATDRLLDIGDELIEKVKAAAGAPLRRVHSRRRRSPSTRSPCRATPRPGRHRGDRHLDRRAAGAEDR